MFTRQSIHTTVQTYLRISSHHNQHEIYKINKIYHLYHFTFNLNQNTLVYSTINLARKFEACDHVTFMYNNICHAYLFNNYKIISLIFILQY